MKQWLIQGWGGLSFEKQLTIIAVIFSTVVAAGWAVYIHVSGQPDKPVSAINLIDESNDYLNIGQYAEAKQRFSKAYENDNQDLAAAWGQKKSRSSQKFSRSSLAYQQHLLRA